MEDLEYLKSQLNVLKGTKPAPVKKVYAQNWKLSKAGNYYCFINGKNCIVGQCKTGSWWGRTPDGFANGYFPTKEQAIEAVNRMTETN